MFEILSQLPSPDRASAVSTPVGSPALNVARINVQIDATCAPTSIECSPELLSALIIAKGVTTVSDLDQLLSGCIDICDLQCASAILKSVKVDDDPASEEHVLPPAAADVERIYKDAKYATVVQDQLDKCRFEENFLLQFKPHIVALTLNSNGCRVVQKLFDVVAESRGVLLLLIHPELSSRIIDASLDVNGNHVVQKCIDVLPSEECEFIVTQFEQKQCIRKLATHCYGCRVIQKLMSKCGQFANPIFESLCGDPTTITHLSEDVFGNYVIQHAVQFGRDIDRERIALCLATNVSIVNLCCSKFASNVVEKCVRAAGGEGLHRDSERNQGMSSAGSVPIHSHSTVLVIRLLINSILVATDPITREPGLITLMKDRYGNYVVRAIMELSRPEFAQEVSAVKSVISRNSNMLKKFTFSWHLVERLDKLGCDKEAQFLRRSSTDEASGYSHRE